MRLHGIQMDIAWEDRERNFQRVRDLLAKEALEPGDLVVLPEMYSSGFSMNVENIHEGEARPGEKFLSDLAAEHRVQVVGGVVRRATDGRGCNEAVVFGPDRREEARYAKIHPFSYAGETDFFAPGEEFVLFDWSGFRVAPFVCYDLRFPELFRRAMLAGANLFLVIANWPAPRAAHWRALLLARAIENQAYVLGVNRCGTDPKLEYAGGSLLVGPRGDVLAELGNTPQVLTAEPNLDELQKYRADFPAWKDVHPEFLGIRPR